MNKHKKLNITDWATEDRPREKLDNKGPRHLTEAELIAIIIGSGNEEETAVELSRRMLSSTNNNLNALAKKGIPYFETFRGIGKAKAVSIMAALELGNRRKEASVFTTNKVRESKDIADYFQPILGYLNHEEFWVMMLDRANKVIDTYMLSQGGISGTVIDVRIILKNALDKQASSIILVHNHPSGNLTPSHADRNVTRKIFEAAKIMDIQVLDHIIIGQNSYLSFADEGMLN